VSKNSCEDKKTTGTPSLIFLSRTPRAACAAPKLARAEEKRKKNGGHKIYLNLSTHHTSSVTF
jgi:hypothetical protein